ncbi:MAG: response regulator [Deltaproteobacteria bacterium]|nr:response regulator [Deltaproteobacteria bacterium]
MATPLRLLLVEDSEDDCTLLLHQLREAGYQVTCTRVETAAALHAALATGSWDIVITDYSLPQFSGPAALQLVQESGRDLPVIVVSGAIGEEIAVAMMKAGAHDFARKGHLTRLGAAIERELQAAQQRRERRRAEEALRHNEAQFRSLIEHALDLISILTLDGTVRFASPSYEAVLGYAPAAIEGGNLFDQVHPDDLPATRQAFAQLLAHPGDTITTEVRLRHRDGSWRTLESLATNLLADPVVAGIVVNARDISERKRAEQASHQAKLAAEAASRAKSEFVAEVSHQIRTPMSGIMGAAELVLASQLSADQRECVELIKTSAEQLLTVVNDMLDVAKVEAGKLDLVTGDFSLQAVVHAAIELVALRVREKGVEFMCQVAAEVPDALSGDGDRLRQILTNLADSAVKVSRGGDVVMRVELESQTDAAATLHFSVSQSGGDLVAEHQQVLFDTVEPANSATGAAAGNEIGVVIAAKLVAIMGGQLWAARRPRGDSAVHFTACFGRATAPAASPAAVEALRDLPVLVVDDNAANGRLLEEMLGSWGLRPSVVNGGWAALAAMAQAVAAGEPFPLVVVDAQMPEMDGFALMEEIKKRRRLAGATVMLLPVAASPEERARGRESGAGDFVIKPVQPAELRAAVLAALAGHERAVRRRPVRPAPELQPEQRPLRVLLAEDNLVNQHLTVRLLEKRGHHVVAVSNGRAALAAVEREAFDLVLMDVQMPEMDGLQATAAIRAGERTTGAHLPIVALTARAMKGDNERCLAAGMDAYVSKPLQAHKLFATIRSVLADEAKYRKPASGTLPAS